MKVLVVNLKLNELTEASETPHKHIIWVDDLRNPPAAIEGSCDIARTYDEAVHMLSKHMYTEIYLDHDLGDVENENGRREMTGYDVLLWLIDAKHKGKHVPTKYHILTANASARPRMEGVINRYLSS